jgi:hypothetical protein
MTTKLADYVGHTLTGHAYCNTGGERHAHDNVVVKVTAVTDDGTMLKVETEGEFCSQTAGIADTGWVSPIFTNDDDDDPFDYLAFGQTPFAGDAEEGDIELQLDFAQ